jgi:tetratricopeptide (TPR) repeat protein
MCDNIRDLGEDYLVSGNYEEALQYFTEVLELSKNSGLLWYETRSYISLSQLHYLTGNKEESQSFSGLGLEYSEKINARDLIIEALWNQAKVKSSSGSFNEIRKLFLTAIELAESVGHKTFLWKLYKDFGSFLSADSKDLEAGIYKNKSGEILQGILANLDMELKKTFLSSPSVKEVLNLPEKIEKI